MDTHAKRRTALALVTAGAAWPSLLCAITDAMATPLQRALQTSWCGAGPQAFDLFGHCPACWSGGAAFILAAAMVIRAPNAVPSRRL